MYIPDEAVRAADVEAVRYFEDHIEAKNVLEIRARNKRKGENPLQAEDNRKNSRYPLSDLFQFL